MITLRIKKPTPLDFSVEQLSSLNEFNSTLTFSLPLHRVVQRRVGEVIHVIFERHSERLVLWILILTAELGRRVLHFKNLIIVAKQQPA